MEFLCLNHLGKRFGVCHCLPRARNLSSGATQAESKKATGRNRKLSLPGTSRQDEQVNHPHGLVELYTPLSAIDERANVRTALS